MRIVHDLTYSGTAANRRRGGEEGGQLTRGRTGTTLRSDGPYDQENAGADGQIREGRRLLIRKIDAKSSFRQVGADPTGAASFGCVLGGCLFIDLQLPFGWRGGAGWREVIASAMQQAQRETAKASAMILAAGSEVTAHARIAGHTEVAVEPLPQGCIIKCVEEGGTGDHARIVFFTDDAVSVELRWEADGRKCLALALALTSIHHQTMGEGEEEGEPLLSHKMVTGCPPRQEVLGFDLNTERMTVSLPNRNISESRKMLKDWLEEQNKATS